MMNEIKLTCVVPGSFKYKSEIDQVIEELENLGVLVLDPPRGQVVKSGLIFNPLQEEVYLSWGIVEGEFLRNIGRSHFAYVVNPGGYVGETVAFELGYALAAGKPIYAKYAFDIKLDYGELWSRVQNIPIYTPDEAVKDARLKHLSKKSFLTRPWLPGAKSWV